MAHLTPVSFHLTLHSAKTIIRFSATAALRWSSTLWPSKPAARRHRVLRARSSSSLKKPLTRTILGKIAARVSNQDPGLLFLERVATEVPDFESCSASLH